MLHIALSMSYVGNDWQIEARNMVNAEARTPPYDKTVKLEELARDGVYEFCFVCLPVPIDGATGSMVRPVALC